MMSSKVNFTVRLLPLSKETTTLEGNRNFHWTPIWLVGWGKLTFAWGRPGRGKGDEMIALCPTSRSFFANFSLHSFWQAHAQVDALPISLDWRMLCLARFTYMIDWTAITSSQVRASVMTFPTKHTRSTISRPRFDDLA
jgi:hypothetical protein